MSAENENAPRVFSVTMDGGESFACAENEKVLSAMERAHLQTIQVGCRGGGCGACRVEVLEGDVEALRMSKTHVDADEAAQGFALACRILPKSDLVIRVAQKLPQEQNGQDETPQAVAANS